MSEFICNKCNHEFLTKSNLNRHLKKKNTCIKENDSLLCEFCNLTFTQMSSKTRHEKSNKHKLQVNFNSNNNINGNYNQVGNNNLMNIVHLTINTNPFKDTNLNCIDSSILENIVFKFIDNQKENKVFVHNFMHLVKLLEKIHFDLRNETNQNLRILLMFPNLSKKIVEYLILEINPETKEIMWYRLEYEEFLDKLIILMEELNNKLNVDKFIDYINYMKIELYKKENKNIIEAKLIQLYKNYSIDNSIPRNQKKGELIENINEYKKYRENECKLKNGFSPKIINSLI